MDQDINLTCPSCGASLGLVESFDLELISAPAPVVAPTPVAPVAPIAPDPAPVPAPVAPTPDPVVPVPPPAPAAGPQVTN